MLRMESDYHNAFDRDMKNMGYKGKDDPQAEHDFFHVLHHHGIISHSEFNEHVNRLGTHHLLGKDATKLSFSEPSLRSDQWSDADAGSYVGGIPDFHDLPSSSLQSLRKSSPDLRVIITTPLSSSLSARTWSPNHSIPAVRQIMESARIAAITALSEGKILLTSEEGKWGVWANSHVGRFFVELAIADRAYVKPSDNPNDHFAVWAQGKGRRPVQLQVDATSGKIVNSDEVLKSLLGMSPEEQEKALQDIEAQVEQEQGVESDGPEMTVPSDQYDKMPAVAESGGTTNLILDAYTGHVLNWAEAKFKVESLSPSEVVELTGIRQYVKVRGYTRKDGTPVSEYRAQRSKAQIEAQGHRVSWEAVSGAKSEFAMQAHTMNYADKLAYTHAVISSFTSDGKDELAEACGLPAPKFQISPGWWEGVSNPSVQADFGIPYSEENNTKIEAYAAILGKALHQDAMAMHHAKVSANLEESNILEFWTHTPLNASDVGALMASLSNNAPGASIFPVVNQDGVRFLNGTQLDEKELNPIDFRLICQSVIKETQRDNVDQLWGYTGANSNLIESQNYDEKIGNFIGQTTSESDDVYDQRGSSEAHRTGRVGESEGDGQTSQAGGSRPSVDPGRLLDLQRRIEETASRAAQRNQDVNLSESTSGYGSGGAPPKELRPGDHWVTLKPQGPDSEEHRHVIIRAMKDGSGMIVWAGNKGLTHLRLNKVHATEGDYKNAAKSKPKILSPEQAQADKDRRQQRLGALDQSRQTFGQKLVENLGLSGVVDPEAALAAVETGVLKPQAKSGEQSGTPKEKREGAEGEQPQEKAGAGETLEEDRRSDFDIQYTYSIIGARSSTIITASDRIYKYQYSYDLVGNLTRISVYRGAGVQPNVAYTYLTDVNYTYDALDRVIAVKTADINTLYTYDVLGQVTVLKNLRVDNMVVANEDPTLIYTDSKGFKHTILSQFTGIGYDVLSNRTGMGAAVLTSNGLAQWTVNYGFGTSAQMQGIWAGRSSVNNSYSLDAGGNLATARGETFTTNLDSDRLTQSSSTFRDVAYDPLGNTSQSRGNAMTYYPTGQLKTVINSTSGIDHEFQYDAGGFRTGRRSGTMGWENFGYDGAGLVFHSLPPTSVDNPGEATFYVWGPTGPILQICNHPVASAQVISSFTYDPNGNTVARVSTQIGDVSGLPYVERATVYDAYGKVLWVDGVPSVTGSQYNPFGYKGQVGYVTDGYVYGRPDLNTGLIY